MSLPGECVCLYMTNRELVALENTQATSVVFSGISCFTFRI